MSNATATTTYSAYALTPEQAEVLGADALTILIQGSIEGDYTGEDIELVADADLTDTDAMDALLAANGWTVVRGWEVGGSQTTAQVERI